MSAFSGPAAAGALRFGSNYLASLLDRDKDPDEQTGDEAIVERLRMFQPQTLQREVAKGVGRGAISVLEAPIQTRAALAGIGRGLIQKASGAPTPSIPTEQENVANLIHSGIKQFTTGKGFLAMQQDVEGRAFAWNDPRWWAGRGGESLAFLLSLAVPGMAAARGAQAAGFGARAARLIGASASGATSAALETGLSRADFREQLIERGLTESEADILASYGATGYGIVAGFLDVISLNQLLKRVPGGRKQVMQLLITMATEAGTEEAQEELSFVAERLLDIDDPGSEGERRLAALSLGALAAGTVTPFISRVVATDATNEVSDGPLLEALESLSTEERTELGSILAAEVVDDTTPIDEKSRKEAVVQKVKELPEVKEPTSGFGIVESRQVPIPVVEAARRSGRARTLARRANKALFAPVPPASESKAVRGARRGAIDLGLLTTPFRGVAEIAGGTINIGIRDVIDRVEHISGPEGKVVADKARRAVAVSKEVIGQLSEPLRKAMEATRGITLSQQKASIGLQRIQWVNDKSGKPLYGVARVVDAVEGRLEGLTEGEQRIVNAERNVIDAAGRIFRDRGHKQFNYKTSKWEPFRYIPGGKVYPRLMHENFVGIIDKGEGPLFNATVEAIADINNVDKSVVESLLARMREDYRGTGGPASFHRINAEFARQLPRMPTHVRVAGDTIELVETHPFTYIRRIVTNASSRSGFIDQFGQAVGPKNELAAIQKRIAATGGSTSAFLSMTRALNGMPVEPPIIEAGSPARATLRAAKGVDTLARTGLLTMATIPNIPEPLGNIQAMNGSADLLRAIWTVTLHPRATILTLEQLGAITRDFANLAFNPNRPFESIVRGLRETVNRATGRKFIEEFQEILGGAVALEKVDRMQQGKGNAGDIIDLMAMMKWSPEDARRVAKGQGSEAEYLAVVRRAPAFMTAGAIQAAEKSRISHNKLYRAAIAFELYAQAKIRSLLNLAEAYGRATKEKDARLFAAANLKMSRYIAGTAAAGSIQYFLMALVTGGTAGLKIAWEEMKDDPIDFFVESFIYAMFAGPYGSVIRVAGGGRGGGPWTERMIRATLPGFLIDESVRAFTGTGTYTNMDWPGRMGRFFERLIPVNKAGATVMAIFGFGRDQLAMDASVRGYWNWRFKEKPPTRTTGEEVEDDTRRFRVNMRKAYSAIKRQDDPSKYIAIALAVPEKDNAAVRRALLRRRLLTVLDIEEQLALKNRIGEDAFGRVAAHDAILTGWAESFRKPRKRK